LYMSMVQARVCASLQDESKIHTTMTLWSGGGPDVCSAANQEARTASAQIPSNHACSCGHLMAEALGALRPRRLLVCLLCEGEHRCTAPCFDWRGSKYHRAKLVIEEHRSQPMCRCLPTFMSGQPTVAHHKPLSMLAFRSPLATTRVGLCLKRG
jgi:hypothetical protein